MSAVQAIIEEGYKVDTSTVKSLAEILGIPLPDAETILSDFRDSIDRLIATASMVREARNILLERIQSLNEIDLDGYFAEVPKIAWETRTGIITDYVITVIDNSDHDRPQLYSVSFSPQDYPDMGVKKGYTVRRHHAPSEYKTFDEAYEGLWTTMEADDPFTREVIGIGLYLTAPQYIGVANDNVSNLFDHIPN